MPDPTSPFHDPHAEPVQPIRVELDDRTLDPFAGLLQAEEAWVMRPTPQPRASVENVIRSNRTPRVVVRTPADLGETGPLAEYSGSGNDSRGQRRDQR